jgi:hypothetical protein
MKDSIVRQQMARIEGLDKGQEDAPCNISQFSFPLSAFSCLPFTASTVEGKLRVEWSIPRRKKVRWGQEYRQILLVCNRRGMPTGC